MRYRCPSLSLSNSAMADLVVISSCRVVFLARRRSTTNVPREKNLCGYATIMASTVCICVFAMYIIKRNGMIIRTVY